MSTTAPTGKQRKRIGKYSLFERLGSGGMSRVYRAIAADTGAEVALKVTPIENDVDVEVADYQREVMIGRRLRHPNVISASDHGCRDGHIFLAMPVVEGATLSNMTRLRDPLRKPSSKRSRAYDDEWAVPMIEGNWPQIASIGIQLSSALVACHAAGVIHRDIKPGNVLMDRDGDVFLMDFGLSWMKHGPTDHELTTKDGTARYLPPEVFEERRDERSDIYSLGLTLHELATGRKPWGDIHHEVIKEKRPQYRVPPVRSIRPEIPEQLASCIDRASADEPAERYQTAEEMERAFRAAARHLPRYETITLSDSLAMEAQHCQQPVLSEEVWFN